MTLATQGPAGPWAAAVFYANNGFNLYFVSSPASRHSRNLAGQPAVTATVHEDYLDWREIDEAARYYPSYSARLSMRPDFVGAAAAGQRGFTWEHRSTAIPA